MHARGLKRASDCLGLQLEVVGSLHVVLGIKAVSCGRTASETSVHPHHPFSDIPSAVSVAGTEKEGAAEKEGKKCRFGENNIHGWVRGLERFKPLFLVHQ